MGETVYHLPNISVWLDVKGAAVSQSGLMVYYQPHLWFTAAPISYPNALLGLNTSWFLIRDGTY